MTPSLTECTKQFTATKLKVAEYGRQAIFLNPTRSKFRVIRADGCLYLNMLAADFIVCGPEGDVITELKGSDVGHAVDQILSTFDTWSKEEASSHKICGLIVCSRVPRFDTKIQRAKVSVAKRFKARLHVCSRNQEHDFASLF